MATVNEKCLNFTLHLTEVKNRCVINKITIHRRMNKLNHRINPRKLKSNNYGITRAKKESRINSYIFFIFLVLLKNHPLNFRICVKKKKKTSTKNRTTMIVQIVKYSTNSRYILKEFWNVNEVARACKLETFFIPIKHFGM